MFIPYVSSKLTDLERSTIRHVSYCRKKLREPLRPRTKSCVQCIKRKISCDLSRSNPCSRCLQKGVICRYEDRRRRDQSVRASQPVNDQMWEDVPASDVAILPRDSSRKTDVANLTFVSSPMGRDSVRNISAKITTTTSPDFIDQSAVSLSRERPLRPFRAFDRRFSATPSNSLLWRYVVSTLRSYSRMNVGDNQLPPFIHPKGGQQGRQITDCRLLERLAACSAITTWWSKNNSDRVFMWKVIRMEQERLSEEVRRSAQALDRKPTNHNVVYDVR